MAEYDAMGSYTGFDEEPVNPYDYQEEERKKEELKKQLEAQVKKQDQLASQVSHKQEITTMADGSQVEKTTKRSPAGGPVSPDDYNKSIAQQESGNNPNIGYHDQSKSSAYGPYGITSGAYADARKANPALPEDITKADSGQMTSAQDAITQNNSKYLQSYGVPVNDNTLQAAHFLGAKGLSDYLKTGYISEAAAKANGGVENVKRIVDKRLGGMQAAASGAANLQQGEQGGMPTQKPQTGPIAPEQQAQQAQQPPQGPVAPQQAGPAFTGQGLKAPNAGNAPTPGEEGSKGHIERYQADQNDPAKLMELSTSEGTPDWMKDRARNRAADIITNQREAQNAQQTLSTATPTELAKYMREKSSGGSWIKAIFYGAIGAKQLAQEEAAKLGIGTEKIVTDQNGKAHIVKVSANGTPLEGYSADSGKKMTAEELVAAIGGASAGNKVSTSAEQFQDKAGNIYRSQSNEKGQLVMRNAVTGKVYEGDPTKLTRMRDVAGAEADERKQGFKKENMTTEQTNRLAVMQTQLGNDLTKAKAKDRLSIFSDTNKALVSEGLPTLTMAQMGLNQDGTLTSEKPQAAAQPAAATQGAVAPTTETGAAPSGAVSPEAAARPPTLSEINKRKEEEKSARETKEAAAKKIATEAAEAVAASPQTIVNMNKIDKAISHLEKNTTNFGSAGGGLRKGELSGGTAQKVGRFFDTEDARNTQDVMEAINGVVLERANLGKMTDKDLEFYTAGKPTIDDSPARVQEWLSTAKTDLKNKLEFNKQQAASGGRKGPMEQATPVAPPPSIPTNTSKIIGGVTYVYDGKGWKKK